MWAYRLLLASQLYEPTNLITSIPLNKNPIWFLSLKMRTSKWLGYSQNVVQWSGLAMLSFNRTTMRRRVYEFYVWIMLWLDEPLSKWDDDLMSLWGNKIISWWELMILPFQLIHSFGRIFASLDKMVLTGLNTWIGLIAKLMNSLPTSEVSRRWVVVNLVAIIRSLPETLSFLLTHDIFCIGHLPR